MLYLAALWPRNCPITLGFHSEPERLRAWCREFSRRSRWIGASVVQLGLLLLIATPWRGWLFSAVAFGVERDSMYVVITLVVLGILLYSLFGY